MYGLRLVITATVTTVTLLPVRQVFTETIEQRPKFLVTGYSNKTGEEIKRTYFAKDEEEAILKANKDGIIVDIKMSQDKLRIFICAARGCMI